jgi:hypothetical protein
VTQPGRLAFVGLGLLFGAGAEWLRIQSGWPASWVVGDAIPGVLFFVAGFLAWGRRPGNPIGPLMIAAGFAWFVGTYGASRNPVIDRLGVGFQGWYDFLIAALILMYPTGRLVGLAPRVVLVAFGILIAILSAA